MPEPLGRAAPAPAGQPPSSPLRAGVRRRPTTARPSGRATRRWWQRDESGQAAEAVIVFPVLLLIIMMVVQFGLWYHASAVAKAAAAEGVRATRLEGANTADGIAATQAFLAQAGPSIVQSVQLDVTRDDDVARVEIRATAANVVPGLSLPIHAVAESPVEAFRAPVAQP